MDPAQFVEAAPGRLVDVTDACGNAGKAFVPCELPPPGDFGAKALRLALSDADRALARLDGVAGQIERPDLLFRNYLRREAVLSSKIEGTHTTLPDLILFEAAHEAGRGAGGDDQVVANYVDAFDYGRGRCEQIPIGRRLFNELHEILMRGRDPLETTPGRTRDCLVSIGRGPLRDARFVPPPDVFVTDLLENLERFLDGDDEPPLVKLAVAHYQFETIHPYRDGNGRLGRLLISLWLHRARILTESLLYLSAYFEQYQTAYYDALLRVSTHGDWDTWITFFLEGVRTQSIDAVLRTRRLVQLRARYHQMLTGPRVSQNLHRLVDHLFTIPAISVPIARTVTGLTYPAARDLIERLITAEILGSEAKTIRGTAFYVANTLVRALDSPVEEVES